MSATLHNAEALGVMRDLPVPAAGRALTVGELREALADADDRDEVWIEDEGGSDWRPLVVETDPGRLVLHMGGAHVGVCPECGDEHGEPS